MGLFSFLGGLVGSAVEFVGDIVEDVTGWDGISKAGVAIQDFFSEEISQESSYDKQSANLYTTERLNEILVSFSEKYLKHSVEIENQCIKSVEDYCDSLIRFLEDSAKITNDTSNLRRVKNNRSQIRKTITGSVKEPLAKRMSLDDSECLKILKMDSGSKKKEEMKAFSEKVIYDALCNLSVNVRRELDEQSESIEDYFTTFSESREKEVENIKKQYDSMLQTGIAEESEIEKGCIKPLVIIRTAELIESKL